MPAVPIKRAQDGDVLIEDAVNTDGAVLCRAGTTLSAELIQKLVRLGVQTVIVHGTDGGGPKIDIQELQKIEKEIEKRFEHVNDNPFMAELKLCVLRVYRDRV